MIILHQDAKLKQIWWTKLNKSGIPKFLCLSSPLGVDVQYDRAVLTALGYYRLYHLSPDNGVINSITEGPSKIPESHHYDELEDFAKEFFEQRGILPFQPSEAHPIFATTKASANGSLAMGDTSILDAKAVDDLSIKPIIDEMIGLVYQPEQVTLFWKMYNDSLDQFSEELLPKRYPLSSARIHLISEGGGKTRPICIPDIWTQIVLKPIHKYFMDCLKRMPNDGTFSHSDLSKRVKGFTSRHSLYCFDLTAATDRMPIRLQEKVLTPLLGDLSVWWTKLISERDFRFKDQQIRYGTGQPMGMLSSWAAMSLTHHVIINHAKKDKSFYAVIGDDMVLHRKEAARRYLETLDRFGMEYSDEKSLYPSETANVGEIAKRYFRNGLDISPIPPKVLLESTKNLEGFIEFLEVLASRTNNIEGNTDIDWSEAIFSIWKQNRDYGSESAHAILSCPINGYFPFLDRIRPMTLLLTELGNRWDRSKDSLIKNLLDKFILDESLRELNQNKLLLDVSF